MSDVYPRGISDIARFAGVQTMTAFCRHPEAPPIQAMHRVFVTRERRLTRGLVEQIAQVARMDARAVELRLAADGFVLAPVRVPARVMVRTAAELAIDDIFTVDGNRYRVAWLDAPDSDGFRTARLKLVRGTEARAQ